MASNSGLPAAASLLDVAVRAAVQSGAPRRTVAATAAAVASVVMVELRGGAGASGGASAPPSASMRRRTKRKKKAEKERLATSASLPPPTDGEAGRVVGSGEAPAHVPTSALAPILSSVVEQPPLLPPLSVNVPRNSCQHCSQKLK